MRAFTLFAAVAANLLLSNVGASLLPATIQERALEQVVKPKIFIISMFGPEAEVWWANDTLLLSYP